MGGRGGGLWVACGRTTRQEVNHWINSLFGWRGSRGRESRLNYLVWMFFKGGERGIWRGLEGF